MDSAERHPVAAASPAARPEPGEPPRPGAPAEPDRGEPQQPRPSAEPDHTDAALPDRAAVPGDHGGGAIAWLGRQPYVLLVATMAFWSGNYVAARTVVGEVGPATLAQARWTLALLALPHLRRDARLIRARLGFLALIGAIGIGAYNTLVYVGLASTTVINATLLAALFPVMVALIGYVAYRDRLTRAQAAGIAVATLGAVVVLTHGDLARLAGIRFNPGDLYIVASMTLWALYTVLLRRRPALHPLSFVATTVLIGSLLLTPITALELMHGPPPVVSAKTVAIVVYIALFPSIVAFLAYNRAVEMIGSNRTGPFFHLVPVFGALLAVALLGERIAGFHLVGWALIVAGIAAAQLGARPPRTR